MKLNVLPMICLLSFTVCAQAPQVAEKDAPSKIAIAAKEEPGERLIVMGQVFGPDGKTPLAGASVYVYHTDAKGLYTPETNDNRNPRLRGYMRTDAQGRYEFSTIKPAPYPNNRIAAHIHYVVNAPGHRERVFEIVFEGDPNNRACCVALRTSKCGSNESETCDARIGIAPSFRSLKCKKLSQMFWGCN
jgi:protocatechuate 3,4-dioxygenase beta subunit